MNMINTTHLFSKFVSNCFGGPLVSIHAYEYDPKGREFKPGRPKGVFFWAK